MLLVRLARRAYYWLRQHWALRHVPGMWLPSRRELKGMARAYRQRRERGNVALHLGKRKGHFNGTH